MSRLPEALPALISFEESSAREDSWGRFARLSAHGATVLSLTRLSPLDRLALSFELGEDRVRAAPAVVERAFRDADGYWVAELRWLDEGDRRRLARSLSDLLSR